MNSRMPPQCSSHLPHIPKIAKPSLFSCRYWLYICEAQFLHRNLKNWGRGHLVSIKEWYRSRVTYVCSFLQGRLTKRSDSIWTPCLRILWTFSLLAVSKLAEFYESYLFVTISLHNHYNFYRHGGTETDLPTSLKSIRLNYFHEENSSCIGNSHYANEKENKEYLRHF